MLASLRMPAPLIGRYSSTHGPMCLNEKVLRLGKAAKWIALAGVAGLLGLILAGIIYEQLGRRKDLVGITRIGESVDIGGRALNLYCAGTGSPTVVLESGTNNPGLAWLRVQPKIAETTRACWYDRAGDGWSDPGPFPRTAASIAVDLHSLLTNAKLPGPFIMVGHSFGGTILRVYSGMYPKDVAGVVLVDAWHEDEIKKIPNRKGPGPPDSLRPAIDRLTPALTFIGFVRLLRPPLKTRPPKGLSREDWRVIQELRRQPKALAAESSTGMTQDESGMQARSAGGLGDRPLVVLTAGKAEYDPSNATEAKLANDEQQIWIHDLQAQLATLSTRGKQLTVNSTHGIPWEAPENVVDAVREVIAATASTR
ncbi:MAG: alpha/beta hydrolase [Bryobacterales bacterium]|nr:alpha/beta hydrolase [Bryobacterales bacterium]